MASFKLCPSCLQSILEQQQLQLDAALVHILVSSVMFRKRRCVIMSRQGTSPATAKKLSRYRFLSNSMAETMRKFDTCCPAAVSIMLQFLGSFIPLVAVLVRACFHARGSGIFSSAYTL